MKPKLNTTYLHPGKYRIVCDYKGYVKCPECGRRTKVKTLPSTKMKDFPLWCPHCKKQFIIDI